MLPEALVAPEEEDAVATATATLLHQHLDAAALDEEKLLRNASMS
jgi:hypothetical protein